MSGEYTSKEYIQELEDNLSAMKSELSGLDGIISDIKLTIANNKLFTSTYPYNGEYIDMLEDDYYWNEHKELLNTRWASKRPNRKTISRGASELYYYMALVIYIISSIVYLVIPTKISLIGAWKITQIGLGYAVFELLVLIIGSYYYVVRPNLITRREYKKDIKEHLARKKVLANQIKATENILSNYKLSTLKYSDVTKNSKGSTIASLMSDIENAQNSILAKVPTEFYDEYNKILSDSLELLRITSNNTTIFSDVSKIYNIYLIEINDIMYKLANNSSDINSKEIHILLDNFSKYINRKISKYKEFNSMMVSSNISALNQAILEED